MIKPKFFPLTNTLALEASCKELICIATEKALQDQWAELKLAERTVLILGAGSNVVLPAKLERPVLQFMADGVRFEKVSADLVHVHAGAGMLWDTLVAMTVGRGLCGLENLSWIPGTVGAAPIQNIGAYGVELADVLVEVSVFDLETGQLETLAKEQCDFAYRDSRFKRAPGRYLITEVVVALSASRPFVLNYGELKALQGQSELSVADVRSRVIEIREAKLPDAQDLPNAGSFFKNPVVSAEVAADLRKRFENMVQYPLANGEVKLAAGWLLDQAGWKGKRVGDLGMHAQQALVMVNYGEATQTEVLALADAIQSDIQDKFGVTLEIEPVVIE